MPTPKPANVAERVHKRRNAAPASTNISPSTATNLPGNVRDVVNTSGFANAQREGTKWKRCSRNLRISLDFVASPAEVKVYSRAVLHGSGCAKHHAIGPLPQSRPHPGSLQPPSRRIAGNRPSPHATYTTPTAHPGNLFQHPQAITLRTPVSE
jgi:hypothetical protein